MKTSLLRHRESVCFRAHFTLAQKIQELIFLLNVFSSEEIYVSVEKVYGPPCKNQLPSYSKPL